MTHVVLDSNIVLDVLRPNQDFEADAKRIFRLIGDGGLDASICANSLTDIFYILRKVHGARRAKDFIAHLVAAARVLPLSQEDCQDALALSMDDFEDALIAVCAKKAGADFIVSRDTDFIKAPSDVRVIAPKELLDQFP
jgi:predicted nucleic acid-binding protein